MKPILLVSTVFLMSIFSSRAQYTIGWSTIDGGGGLTSGGAISLNGTVGQPDAGAMSGGNFALSGGFWYGGSGPYPALSIRLEAANTAILSWPNPSTGYVLQQTANMDTPGGGWTDVAQLPNVLGSNKEVTLPATGRFCLFRLRAP
jgi:hypothetical protein